MLGFVQPLPSDVHARDELEDTASSKQFATWNTPNQTIYGFPHQTSLLSLHVNMSIPVSEGDREMLVQVLWSILPAWCSSELFPMPPDDILVACSFDVQPVCLRN